jgi:predicted Fe-S protein YdhL (DUF1289 family)
LAVSSPSTPCIQVCILDPGLRLCLGCGRTIDEIARWSAMTEEERKQIMERLPGRKAKASPAEAEEA